MASTRTCEQRMVTLQQLVVIKCYVILNLSTLHMTISVFLNVQNVLVTAKTTPLKETFYCCLVLYYYRIVLLWFCFVLLLAFGVFFFFGLQEAIKNVLHSVQYNDQKQEYGLGALSGCDAITDMSCHGEVSLFRKKKTKRQLRFTCLCPSFAGDTLDQSRTPFKLPTTCAVTLATGTLPELTCARISSVSDQCVHPTVLQRVEQVQFNKCMCVSTTIHG